MPGREPDSQLSGGADISTMTMETAKSVSSRESLYSVESNTSEEEEEEHSTDFEVFLLDSGSDAEKESGPLRHQQDVSPKERSLLFPPESGRTNPGLRCRDRRHRIRTPLGLLASARLRPCGQRCRSPTELDEMYCARLVETDGSLPRKAASQKWTEKGGRKRLSTSTGGDLSSVYTTPPSLQGVKRQRNKEMEAGGDLTSPWTEKDQLFAQKCWELQGFVRPLKELLSRLKMGRFERGLSTFQQSVAMDRIQRIIGVLQKPEMGERYLGTLLQVEQMLKVWFPNVVLKNCDTAEEKAEKPPSTENIAGRTAASKQGCTQSPPVEELHQTHLTDPASSGGKADTPWEEPPRFLPRWPAMNLTWVHTSPISNPPLGHMDSSRMNSAFGQALLGPNGNAYGVVLFLHDNLAGPLSFDRSTSVTPNSLSPPCCHPNPSLPGSVELPRCQSLPGTSTPHIGVLGGSLDSHSQSLPHLPTSNLSSSSRGFKMASAVPAHCPNS